MPLFQPDDGLLLLVVWSASQSPAIRTPLLPPITGSDFDQAITGDDVPDKIAVKIQAGSKATLPWYYNGTTPLTGKVVSFRARDMKLGSVICLKTNTLGGGGDDQFEMPPLGDDGLPLIDDDGKKLPGYIKFHGFDTAAPVRIDVHDCVVEIDDPDDPGDPEFPSDGTFQVTDHA